MKAFDTVSHRLLVHKLKMFGFSNVYINWIKSFLSDRKQKVIVNGECSSLKDVTSGIPQGSVLGPILFVLYINDLPESLKNNSEIFLYADDTKIFREINNLADCVKLQEDIHCMYNWSNSWMLKFHPQKSKNMKIGERNDSLNFRYNLNEGMPDMEITTTEKDIGVTIDNKLNFEKHMTEKVNKANSVLGVIRRSFEYLNKDSFIMLYKSLVRPHIEYANQIWAPYKQKHIDMLEKVQKRATK